MPDDPHDHLRSDPAMAPLVEAYGPLELSPAPEPFARLVRSVLRQQLSTDAADAIERRLRETVALTPEALLAVDPDRLREAGLSAAKTRYVRAVAEAWRDRNYSRGRFAAMDDDAVHEELTGITGVGEWTADVFLMIVSVYTKCIDTATRYRRGRGVETRRCLSPHVGGGGQD